MFLSALNLLIIFFQVILKLCESNKVVFINSLAIVLKSVLGGCVTGCRGMKGGGSGLNESKAGDNQ